MAKHELNKEQMLKLLEDLQYGAQNHTVKKGRTNVKVPLKVRRQPTVQMSSCVQMFAEDIFIEDSIIADTPSVPSRDGTPQKSTSTISAALTPYECPPTPPCSPSSNVQSPRQRYSTGITVGTQTPPQSPKQSPAGSASSEAKAADVTTPRSRQRTADKPIEEATTPTSRDVVREMIGSAPVKRSIGISVGTSTPKSSPSGAGTRTGRSIQTQTIESGPSTPMNESRKLGGTASAVIKMTFNVDTVTRMHTTNSKCKPDALWINNKSIY